MLSLIFSLPFMLGLVFGWWVVPMILGYFRSRSASAA